MSRQKTKRLEGRFAATPLDVMQSSAWTTLLHGARSTLQVLEVQFNGKANGVQNLQRATCERYGLDHSRALKHAKTLEARGLIVKTYAATYTASRARIPSQWAIGWHDITHTDNRERGTILKAPNGWREWAPPIIQSGRYDRSRLKTAGVLTAELVRYCGRFDTLTAITAVVTPNLLRVWPGFSALDRYVGCYIFGNHVTAGLLRHGHLLHLKTQASFDYNNFCHVFNENGSLA